MAKDSKRHQGRGQRDRVGLDETELRLIALLQTDARLSVHDLAWEAQVSEVTARRKLRRLLGEGIVQTVADVDPFQVGYQSPVIIGLRVERARLDAIATQLCEHPAIRYVGAATGTHDLIIEVIAASNHDLGEFLLNYLAGVEGILETETSLILRIYKQSWNWGVRGVAD